MVKILSALFAVASFVGLFAQNPDGSMPVFWTFGCIAVFAISLRILERQFDKEDQISQMSNSRQIRKLIDDLDLEEVNDDTARR